MRVYRIIGPLVVIYETVNCVIVFNLYVMIYAIQYFQHYIIIFFHLEGTLFTVCIVGR